MKIAEIVKINNKYKWKISKYILNKNIFEPISNYFRALQNLFALIKITSVQR